MLRERQKEHLRKLNQPGENHPAWRGGRRKGGKNRPIRIWSPEHPYCSKDGYVLEHRLVMEKHIGRYLKPYEVIHHLNKDVTDNRIENLKLFSCNKDHLKFERGTVHIKNKQEYNRYFQKTHREYLRKYAKKYYWNNREKLTRRARELYHKKRTDGLAETSISRSQDSR